MTVNLLAWVPEGMVLAADSMLTDIRYNASGEKLTTSFEHGQKIFELGEAPAALMFTGSFVIGGNHMSDIVDAIRTTIAAAAAYNHGGVVSAVYSTFERLYDAHISNQKAAAVRLCNEPDALRQINEERAQRGLPGLNAVTLDDIGVRNDPRNAPPHPARVITVEDVWLIVATYFDNPRAVSIMWPHRSTKDLVPGGRIWWQGSGGAALFRLVNGYDDSLMHSINDPDVPTALQCLERNSGHLTMPSVLDSMPLQDAVDYVEYMGSVASGYDRFTVGPRLVGGQLNMVCLQRMKLTWLRPKMLKIRSSEV